MVKIEPFAVEQWMDEYETTPGVLNIAETCAASVSIDDLGTLSTGNHSASPVNLSTKLTYGAIRGSEKLRGRVAALYETDSAPPLSADNLLITQGAIVANFLLLYTLIGPGDHAVCVYPTYQQLYGVPQSLGAEVSLWKLRQDNGYVPDVTELESLVKSNTKMIILNNPNNPTGATIPKAVLKSIVDFARARDIIILCDEVYSPLYHSPPSDADIPPSILSFGYDKTISTGSMSKAWALAGIRLGWVASRDKGIIEAVAEARDYTTISVSQLDDQVATYALSDEVRPALIKRNLELARTNLALLREFVDGYKGVCSWVKPTAGTTAFIQFTNGGKPVDDVAFCLDVLDKTKVMFLPGSKCFGHDRDFKGYVRVGYVSETAVLVEGLKKLGEYVNNNLSA
ncbi:spartate aminotransferase [Diaporthe amygdali]|uniref:spartate aminotransferase n=1 Tax=Phomopsis amygdali TaxID=1214568 RepID=UPI0022FF401F|nr:spartate aminotransferase [Diaporthe amygdali]KAJ0122206.1 spartate aminotransferase [Diaporthe amygdali]